MNVVTPSISETAFNCPHCNVLTTQYWFKAYAKHLDANSTPSVWTKQLIENAKLSEFEDQEAAERLRETWTKFSLGKVTLYGDRDDPYTTWVANLHLSKCYNCSNISVWVYDKLTWPVAHDGPVATADMPEEAKTDFEEAATIVNASPRGAAALLRLSIQKVCQSLGGKGDNINQDIAELVKRGLDPRVQQALDVVRVVGNNAVHPGEIDLKDDRSTALQLFKLVNLIVDIMITQPAHVKQMFDGLPAGALQAIAKRDTRPA